ncbi:GNAT family N-acetyltransferase [Spirillospora sp. CA-253888]
MDPDRLTLRPVDEADLPSLERFLRDPEAAGPFEWHGWWDQGRWRRRWADNGLLDDDAGQLMVAHGAETANTAEQRALEKTGFTREGVMRAYAFRRGEWRDAVLYAILRDDLERGPDT